MTTPTASLLPINLRWQTRSGISLIFSVAFLFALWPLPTAFIAAWLGYDVSFNTVWTLGVFTVQALPALVILRIAANVYLWNCDRLWCNSL